MRKLFASVICVLTIITFASLAAAQDKMIKKQVAIKITAEGERQPAEQTYYLAVEKIIDALRSVGLRVTDSEDVSEYIVIGSNATDGLNALPSAPITGGYRTLDISQLASMNRTTPQAWQTPLYAPETYAVALYVDKLGEGEVSDGGEPISPFTFEGDMDQAARTFCDSYFTPLVDAYIQRRMRAAHVEVFNVPRQSIRIPSNQSAAGPRRARPPHRARN